MVVIFINISNDSMHIKRNDQKTQIEDHLSLSATKIGELKLGLHLDSKVNANPNSIANHLYDHMDGT